MDIMSERFVAALQAALCRSKFRARSVNDDKDFKTVNLLTFCQYTLLEAGIYSFFGKTILEIDQSILFNMLAFSENAWML